MRLATVMVKESPELIPCVVHDDKFIPFMSSQTPSTPWPTTMLGLIEQGRLEDLRNAPVDAFADAYDSTDVRIMAPIPRPHSNVICVGRNYAEHAAESARARQVEILRNPREFLSPGDVVDARIDRIGSLRNTVGAEGN